MKVQYIQKNTDGVITQEIKIVGIPDFKYPTITNDLSLTPEVAMELKRELENKLANIPL